MKISPEKSLAIRVAVEKNFGEPVRTPGHFEMLAADIFKHTGRTIGISTLKRLWGYITDQTVTSFTTLSLLARYVGFIDWEAFDRALDNPVNLGDKDSDFTQGQIFNARRAPVGTTIVAQWDVAKSITVRKSSDPARFEVISSHNVKLQPGDSVTIETLAIGRPIQAVDCRRGSAMMGNYTGARHSGLKSIDIN